MSKRRTRTSNGNANRGSTGKLRTTAAAVSISVGHPATEDVAGPVEQPRTEDVAMRNAEEAARGLRCPKCHCTDLRVAWVQGNLDGSKSRARICRHCGQRVRTLENVVGEEVVP